LRPYVEASGAFRFFEFVEPSGVTIKGSGAGIGLAAGLFFFVSEAFAVNAGISGATGGMDSLSFDGFDVDIRPGATSFRVIAGITWFP
jgi:hypothetical protein